MNARDMQKVLHHLRRDPVVKAVYDAKSEEIGPNIYRFKAEIGAYSYPIHTLPTCLSIPVLHRAQQMQAAPFSIVILWALLTTNIDGLSDFSHSCLRRGCKRSLAPAGSPHVWPSSLTQRE